MKSGTRILKVGEEPPPLQAATIGMKSLPPSARSGRFATMNAFVDFTLHSLSRASAFVWLLLYRDTKPDGLARTAQCDLAKRAGINVRTVRRACADLASRGLLTVVHRGGIRSGLSTYRVHPLATPP